MLKNKESTFMCSFNVDMTATWKHFKQAQLHYGADDRDATIRNMTIIRVPQHGVGIVDQLQYEIVILTELGRKVVRYMAGSL